MSKFKLAFGIHNHQPVGNFDSVFETAHRDAYLPFLQLLKSYDGLSLSLHQSGILWEWQKKHHPEYFALVRSLISSKRLELMTGGYYEPILTAIPEEDARGQIARLSDYLSANFSVRPSGIWLTERVWEPHLPKLLSKAKCGYLAVDDTHFLYSGLDRSELIGPFITENEGEIIRLLPIQKRLRYLIPFGSPEELIEELKGQAERNPEGMAVYADDGEKFGVWPETHQHCYKDGWLPRFFEALLRNSDWLEMVPLGEAAACPPVGRAYLPSASYEEMLHWSLPTDAFMEYERFEKGLADRGELERFGRFVRGGHWRGFLCKYEESNLMHKRMLRLSRRLSAFKSEEPVRIEETRKIEERLYAAQCNCPYWHGVFGGLYLPHIRQAVFSSICEGEHLLRKLRGDTGLSFAVEDFDADGYAEVIAENDEMHAVFKPQNGGILLDLSLTQLGFCLTDTLSRRREGYHSKLAEASVESIPSVGVSNENETNTSSIHDQVKAKEPGLADYLTEDWHLKRCLIDHFISRDQDEIELSRGRIKEEGNFILEPYQFELDHYNRKLRMCRAGFLHRGSEKIPVEVRKTVTLDSGSARLEVEYQLSTDRPDISVCFAVENNFTFQAGHADDRYLLLDGQRPNDSYLDSIGHAEGGKVIAMVDQYRSLAVSVGSDITADIRYLPIFTVSLSEGGFERVYQGTTILHLFRLRLSAEPVCFNLSIIAGSADSVLSDLIEARTADQPN